MAAAVAVAAAAVQYHSHRQHSLQHHHRQYRLQHNRHAVLPES
jgi:hypothetical protein